MSNVAIISTARVHPGREALFAEWQGKHSVALSRFPGFVSTDMIPPPANDPDPQWTVILTFEDEEAADRWRRSPERVELLAEITPLLDGGAFGETVRDGRVQAPGSSVTEVIFSRVRPGMEERYREWASRIQAAQAKYPGYRGMYLQPPSGGKTGGHWASILRYETAAQLEAWMTSPERKELIAEAQEFIETEEFMHLGTAFPGWMPIDPLTGEGPPNWKAAMLVLLGLFPIVMLEMKYLNLGSLGFNSSLGTFIGNVISVALTSFLTMPLFVRWFNWWLFPKGREAAALTTKGVLIIVLLYAVEVALLWRLLPW